ncbi:hypothetical protein ACIQC9_07035 [Brevundimonas sp. NPDC092305]|uniref:hypothetical protein n=1 Tax=Brevundimonas sp. NPDC092305 TaxID=3363957 RepID=UPI0037F57C3D
MIPSNSPLSGLVGLAAFCLAPPALAQSAPTPADTRASTAAGDAFGVRIGTEQIGLYSDSQVRGFNLQDAGNFRLDGAYFVKSANFVDPVLAGVFTQIGLNALDTDFAAPSGVVNYRLRSPLTQPAVSAEAARLEYGGTLSSLTLSAQSADGTTGASVGGQYFDGESSSGLSSRSKRLGTVVERVTGAGSLKGFASMNVFDLEGSYGVKLDDNVLPGALRHPKRYVPAWSDHDGRDLVAGLIGDAAAAPGMRLRGSVVYSRLELDASDYTLLTVGPDRIARGQTVSNRPRINASSSGSGGVDWDLTTRLRAYAEVRARKTRSEYGPASVISLGDVVLDDGVQSAPLPPLPDSVPGTADVVTQLTGAVGIESDFGPLRWRAEVQKTRYRRSVFADSAVSKGGDDPWLYHGSVIYGAGERWTGFATLTRGLEESGVAPNAAVNRGEILEAGLSTQKEIGLRGRLTDGLTLIASAFEIDKPAAGYDQAGAYRLIGQLKHAGTEFSLTGSLTDDLRVVAGMTWIDARRSGEPVDRGDWSSEATGVPDFRAMTALTWRTPWSPNLSLDGQVVYASDRRLRSLDTLRTPATVSVDLGLRSEVEVGDRAVTVRARLTNLFDQNVWVAQTSETLDRAPRRAFRLSLSTAF